MAFHLVISDTVRFPVKGELTDAAGGTQKFEFDLVARRLPADVLQAEADNKGKTVVDLMTEVITDWARVLGDDGAPVPFTAAALAGVWQVNGMALLAWRAYLEHVGARAKN